LLVQYNRKTLLAASAALFQGAVAVKIHGDMGESSDITNNNMGASEDTIFTMGGSVDEARAAAMEANKNNPTLKKLQDYFYVEEGGNKVSLTMAGSDMYGKEHGHNNGKQQVITNIKIGPVGGKDSSWYKVDKPHADSDLTYENMFEMRLMTVADGDVEVNCFEDIESVALACHEKNGPLQSKEDFLQCFTVSGSLAEDDLPVKPTWEEFANEQHDKNTKMVQKIEKQRMEVCHEINMSTMDKLMADKKKLQKELDEIKSGSKM